jgi:xylose isomerase
MFRKAASIPGVKGIELVGTWDITVSNVKEIGQLLTDNNMALVSIIPDHFSQKRWGKGAFTSRDKTIRRAAIDHTKEMADILDELGGEFINIWCGQDGYDYLLQGNFDEAYDQLVSGIGECARYKPGVRFTIEFKPKEPRNYSYLARSADTLLLAQEIGADNVGVTVDVGHALLGGENVAEVIYRLMRAGKLFHMHFNDNHQSWDDDMIVGSVHTIHYVEALFWLKKTGYSGWFSMDQYPYREDGREALSQSVEWLKELAAKMEKYGQAKLERLMREGEATRISEGLRNLLFR